MQPATKVGALSNAAIRRLSGCPLARKRCVLELRLLTTEH